MTGLIRFIVVAALLALAAPAMAIPYTSTVNLNASLPGQSTGTYTWSNPITDLNFQIPYDTINSASITIQSRRSNGANDMVSLDGYAPPLGALNSAIGNNIATTIYNLPLTYFSPTWLAGQPLNLSLTYDNLGQNQALTIISSTLTFDYTDGNPPVPEPATFLLVGFGFAGGGLLRKKFKRSVTNQAVSN